MLLRNPFKKKLKKLNFHQLKLTSFTVYEKCLRKIKNLIILKNNTYTSDFTLTRRISEITWRVATLKYYNNNRNSFIILSINKSSIFILSDSY